MTGRAVAPIAPSTVRVNRGFSTDLRSSAYPPPIGETLVPCRFSRHRTGRMPEIGGEDMRDWIRAIRLDAADQGTTTAEYAMVTMAAVTFAGLLIKIVSGSQVAGMLTGLVRRALSV
jgi:hypothetical protein